MPTRTNNAVGAFFLTDKPRVVAIVGPTCTGKTALSLWLARQFNGEIIACDSRTVYRYFDVGTAKPSTEERNRAPHHLIDVVDPNEDFTAAQFADLATSAIKDIVGRGALPIVCGGTGFYSRALLEGLSIPAVPPNPEIRARLQQVAETDGNQALHDQLAALDLPSAQRLNPNDRFRVIRALEVCLVTGMPFSTLAGKREESFDTLWIGLTIADREYLKKLITIRLKEQIDMGMVDEVSSLYRTYGRSLKLLQTVNYRDLVSYVEGEVSLEHAVAECERHNYQLARRQIQWFRTNLKIHWFHVDEISREDLEQQASALVETFMATGV